MSPSFERAALIPGSRRPITSPAQAVDPRFPRAAIVTDASLLALRLREHARDFELLASAAPSFEPGTLRRRFNALRAHLVVLLGAVLMLAGCGGSAEPDQGPDWVADTCHVAPVSDCAPAGEATGYACDGRPDPDGLAFSRPCEYRGESGDAETPWLFCCRSPIACKKWVACD